MKLQTYDDVKDERPGGASYPRQSAEDESLVHTEEQHAKEVGEVSQGDAEEHQERETLHRMAHTLCIGQDSIVVEISACY